LIAGVLSNGEQKQNLGTSEEASLLEHCQGEPCTKQILTSLDQVCIDLHHSLVALYIAHALCLCFMAGGDSVFEANTRNSTGITALNSAVWVCTSINWN